MENSVVLYTMMDMKKFMKLLKNVDKIPDTCYNKSTKGKENPQHQKGTKMEELLNEIARTWGLEVEETIEAFRMAERGESAETIKEYKRLVEGMWENDNFGFDL